MLTLRPYQSEALDALDRHLSSKPTNPCVVIPTGGGKSFVMAEAVRRWKESYPPFRCIVLAHRKELVEQNSNELMGIYPDGDIGIYAAGLGKHQTNHTITFAGIDSVYDKAGLFPPFDVIIIDEAHRIPVRGEGKYRRFISECAKFNERMRVVGFTATPFRLGSGPICHKDYILNEIAYEANVGDLIRDGYLCNLRSKVSEHEPDLSKVGKTGGDYNGKELALAMLKGDLVGRAVSDAVSMLNFEGRRCCVWFCVDVAHCESVRERLASLGESCVAVTGSTPSAERDKAVADFRDGKYRHILNVNVFTEGFNVKQVDAVILLRPTLSKGLYAQMVGRGLRLHPDKTDCLVLDYAHCIETHGPIDALDAGEVVIEVCGGCRETFPRGLRQCPRCGWEIPKKVIEEREKKERERQMHEARAAQLAILGSQPHEYPVSSVMVTRHVKEGNASLCVTYRCGVQTFREWVCLDYKGYPREKAERWWKTRFGNESKVPSVDEACQLLFLGHDIASLTESVTVVKRGKYSEIISYKLKETK